MRALLSRFFIILREFDLEYVSLVLREVLWVFPNTLTAEGKYPFQDCQNLPLPIQMLLSGNEKFFQYSRFQESTSNFIYFEKKDDCHSQCISKINDCEKLG